jgi:hypothetical protein
LSVVDRTIKHIPADLKSGRLTRRQLIQAAHRERVIEKAQELRNLGATPPQIAEVVDYSVYTIRHITRSPSCSLGVSPKERQVIREYYAEPGASLRTVAAKVGLSHDTVWRVVKEQP